MNDYYSLNSTSAIAAMLIRILLVAYEVSVKHNYIRFIANCACSVLATKEIYSYGHILIW